MEKLKTNKSYNEIFDSSELNDDSEKINVISNEKENLSMKISFV